MKMTSALKSSFFVAILAGLLAFPFAGFGIIGYEPEETAPSNLTAAVLGASTIPVRSAASLGDIDIVHQEDLTLALGKDTEQKFYNVLPEEYVTGNYEIVVVVPNDVKEQGLTATLTKSDLTYDLDVKLTNNDLENQQINLSLLVISKL
jgi:hypothetical protein